MYQVCIVFLLPLFNDLGTQEMPKEFSWTYLLLLHYVDAFPRHRWSGLYKAIAVDMDWIVLIVQSGFLGPSDGWHEVKGKYLVEILWSLLLGGGDPSL